MIAFQIDHGPSEQKPRAWVLFEPGNVEQTLIQGRLQVHQSQLRPVPVQTIRFLRDHHSWSRKVQRLEQHPKNRNLHPLPKQRRNQGKVRHLAQRNSLRPRLQALTEQPRPRLLPSPLLIRPIRRGHLLITPQEQTQLKRLDPAERQKAQKMIKRA